MGYGFSSVASVPLWFNPIGSAFAHFAAFAVKSISTPTADRHPAPALILPRRR
jgi:hypothetical protein